MGTLMLYGTHTEAAAREIFRSGFEGDIYQIDAEATGAPPSARLRSDLDYLTVDHRDAIAEAVHIVVRTWYRAGDENLTEWEGLSLGEAVTGPLMLMQLFPVLMNACVARLAFEELRPDRLLMGRGVGLVASVWEAEAALAGVPVVDLSLDPMPATEPQWSGMGVDPPQPVSLRGRLARRRDRLSTRAREVARALDRALRRPPVVMALVERGRFSDLRNDGFGDIRRSGALRVKYLDTPQVARIRSGNVALLSHSAHTAFAERWVALDAWLGGDRSPLRVAGRDLWPPNRTWFRDFFTGTVPGLAVEASVAMAAMRKIQPSVVLTRNLWGAQATVWALAARSRGVPVVSVLHENFVPNVNEFYADVISDWVLTVGPSSVEWLGTHGVPPDRAVVVGDPMRSDIRSAVEGIGRDEARRALGLDERPVVVYADANYGPTSPVDSAYLNRTALATVRRTAHDMPSVQFVVKFHRPQWSLEGEGALQRRVDFLRRDLPENLTISPLRSDIRTHLAAADVLITDTSSAGLEAMAAGVPVLYLRTRERGFPLPDYEGPSAAIGLHDIGAMAQTLKEMLADLPGLRRRLEPGAKAYWAHFYGAFRDRIPIVEALARGEEVT